jgi:hypothetical protein
MSQFGRQGALKQPALPAGAAELIYQGATILAKDLKLS